METHLSVERMDMDCHNANQLSRCVLENGGLMSHLGSFEIVGGEGDAKGASLFPITPVPRVENGDLILVTSTSLSSESPQSSIVEDGLTSESSDEVVGSGCEGSPRTPKQGVFSPFAPGPEEMCLAPCKKIVKGSRRIVARRLNFDDVSKFPLSNEDGRDSEIQLEKMLLETVYETLLEAIILKLTEEFLTENQDLEFGGCGTPTLPPPLNGILRPALGHRQS
ncbi:hypothetical protein KSS87_011333 [Heliosperma pusillum]|nr:hypothetical protein KSS87_011333 [Heliosperma pusillum]